MKKFTFLMSLLLMLGSSATKAQTTEGQTCTYKKFTSTGEAITNLDDLVDGGTYVFLSAGKNKYIKTIYDNNFKLNNDASLTDDDESDGLAVFKFHISGSGEARTYSFETAIEGCYMKPVVDGACYAEVTDTPATFKILTTNANGQTGDTGVFFIKNSENTTNGNWFDMQNDQFVGWAGSGSNAGYKILPATVSTEVVDTHGYIITKKIIDENGNEVADLSSKTWQEENTVVTFNAPNASFNYTFTPNFESGTTTVSSERRTFSYTITKTAAPVKFDNTWYGIKSQNNENRILIAKNETANADGTGDNVWHVLTETNKAFNQSTLPDYTEFNNALWCFEEDGYGVKIRNKQTGLYIEASNGGIATLTANGTRFFFRTTTANNADFSLWNGNGNQYLGSHTTYNGANKRLGFWGGGDQNNSGSSFGIEEGNNSENILSLDKTVLTAGLTPNEADVQYVTSGLAADIARVQEKAQDATTIANLDELYAEALTQPIADIDANGYYRLAAVNPNCTKKYPSTQNIVVDTEGSLAGAYSSNTGMDRVVKRVTANDAFVPMLWKLEANADGTFKIRNANNGRLMSRNESGVAIDMPINDVFGGDYTLKAVPSATFANNDGKTMFLLTVDGHRMNAFQGDYNDVIQDYNGNHDNDNGNYWRLEKVTEVPAPISEAGYASVGFPFAVQVPAGSGVKAYYASEAAGEWMTLEEFADGIIPAYQGAILVCEGGKSDLKLAITTTDKTYTNKLVAATAKRTGFEEESIYLMAKDTDDTVKFLKNGINVVPANKAYLPSDNVDAGTSYAVAFNFGGGASTGIGTTKNIEEAVQYFDLNGRRVLYPTSGVYVTNTGKKVFIK